ncbi:DUF6248 family natural product biosynthesis protein [Nonomuraea sp. NPDC026600]|uniref:DUF6248 family natural product biosynthesis protein n=1 Tax=Nonomuraea sp. NPDC026600 TaxID=3155363 RepID=UPI0033CD9712
MSVTLAPLSPAQAEWIRANAWTAQLRKEHASHPAYRATCSCQHGKTGHCDMGKCGKCERGEPLPSWETVICDRSGIYPVHMRRPFLHPTPSATIPQRQQLAMVWLADRVCRWVCPCPCHHPTKRAAMTQHLDPTRPGSDRPRGPLGDGGAWQAVMEAAEYRCQCTRCPAHRRDRQGRCETEHGPGVRLSIGPSDPSPDPARRPELHRGKSVAWCEPCWKRAVSVSAKLTRQYEERQLREKTDTLF